MRIGGRPIGTFTRPELARLIAYVPQAQAAPFPYTTLDLVLMGRIAHRGVFAGPTRQDRDIAGRSAAISSASSTLPSVT